MATHYYSCCSIPAKPTSQTSSNNSIWLPNHLVSIPRHRNNLVPYLSSAFSLGDSISAAATSVGVDGPTTSTNPSRSLPFRVGHGFDLHRLEPGYPLIIGGIDIPHDRGCEAHSDGDVLLHCVVDAILGALGLPDIGQIFPDSDSKWKGAASSVFIKEAVNISLIWEKPVSYTTSKVMLYADINLCYMLSSRSSVVVFCMYSLQENPC
ncbi:2-C-methyl-D-erythritol 2,4-cyclodiphosphate synthase, chloroplastic isoform X3 [Gossypium raimondii]|uniref:2-C-methyl-D-erythritol 2,4-cyclodiphosphate synthase, chloroplastic isoform X3 n=1 Tax=Gossypium raimondii TaxID=29730 RepID=UPI00063A8E7A|nr:2-C-methyl-D-erythritol 2,4-cyclodiphosphate synthase, chloroplastic isoform X3 [Gossypium raimondii]